MSKRTYPRVFWVGRPAPDLAWTIIPAGDVAHAVKVGWHVIELRFAHEWNAAHEREASTPAGERGQ